MHIVDSSTRTFFRKQGTLVTFWTLFMRSCLKIVFSWIHARLGQPTTQCEYFYGGAVLRFQNFFGPGTVLKFQNFYDSEISNCFDPLIQVFVNPVDKKIEKESEVRTRF